MIVGAILGLVVTVLGTLLVVFPTGSLDSIFGTPQIPSVVFQWGAAANGFFPVVEMANMTAALTALVYTPILLYKMANWVWRHMPQIGGFGPGSG